MRNHCLNRFYGDAKNLSERKLEGKAIFNNAYVNLSDVRYHTITYNMLIHYDCILQYIEIL